MPVYVAVILGAIFALASTILAVIFITPESKRSTLNNFFKFVHDLFNFKFLIIEKILKFLYIFSTCYCIMVGFFMLFSVERFGSYYSQSYALPGLLVMVLGPVAVRIVYEGIMMFILLVKNVIQINNKLKSNTDGNPAPDNPIFANPVPEQPVEPEPAEPARRFCTQCGAPYEEGQNVCTQCGRPLK